MRTNSTSIASLRWLVAVVGLVSLALAGLSFYRFGSTPTDENLFISVRSPAYLQSAVPADALAAAEGGALPGEAAQGLQAGDLLLVVGDQRVRVAAQVRETAETPGDDGYVDALLLRLSSGKEFRARVRADALAAATVRDVAGAAQVTDVQPGGASDRAGMKRGDLIVRINGQPFYGAIEADQIMRRAQAGRATAYDVLRGGQLLTLNVVLASFGFRLTVLAVVVAGFSWIVFGLTLGLARPQFRSATFLALGFIGLGFVLMVFFVRPATGRTTFDVVRDVVMTIGLFGGLAAWAHGALHFPRDRPENVSGWQLSLLYLVAVAGGVAVWAPATNPIVFVVAVTATVLVSATIKWRTRRARSADERRLARAVDWTERIASLVAIGFFLLPPIDPRDPGPAGIVLVAVPLAYVWTIGRYRLLDLDLRVPRAVQYVVASWAWGALSLVALIWLIALLPSVRMPVLNVRVTGGAVELLQQPMSAERREAHERLLLMVVAIGLAFGFREIGRRGQQWIASKFHRTAYDYRRTSRELSELIGSRLDLEGLADGVIETLRGLMPLARAGVIFVHDGRTYCGSRARGFEREAWQRFCAASAADVLQGTVRSAGEVDAEYTFPRLRRALEAARVRYLYPIRTHDKLVGILLVGEKLSEAAFDSDDFEFLGAVARQIAPAVDNAFLYEELAGQERLKHELAIARRIQLESLPQHTPRIEGLDIAGISIPAMEVGGDYFDYLNGAPRRLTVMVGDVSGKGTSAALYMSKLQGILRSLHAFDLSPHEMFVRTNQLLCRDLERRSFVTALGGFFDTSSRTMVLARAGHLPLYHLESGTGAVNRLLPRGLGFGLSNREVFDTELEARVVPYTTGDLFLFITDGITESLSPNGEEFGEDRVMDLLVAEAGRYGTATKVRDAVMTAVRTFSNGTEQFDDQTVVVVRAV